jgi:hypothetical protein
MNTLFSRPRNEPYSDSYNPTWSNQSNISWQAQALKNYASQFHELYHQAHPQFNDQSYSPQYQPTLQQQSQATPSPKSDSDVQAQMFKLLREIHQTVTSQNQMVNSHSESISKIKAHEEEPSPIYWPQFFTKIGAKIEAHVEQIINHLNREEEELQRQSVANPNGHYVVDESTSYYEQAITTMKNGEVVETHVENRMEEQIVRDR